MVEYLLVSEGGDDIRGCQRSPTDSQFSVSSSSIHSFSCTSPSSSSFSMANNTELWLVYHQTSRTSKPATAQLIDLELQHPLTDLEDVLEHIFQQGFVDAKYRSMTWWEQHDGVSVKATHGVQELLKLGVGRSPETALRLVIGK